MILVQKLKAYEKNIVFLRWATDAEYGRIKYVGADFIEFEVLDLDTYEYAETVLINHQLVLEVVVGGSEVSRIIAEMSHRIDNLT